MTLLTLIAVNENRICLTIIFLQTSIYICIVAFDNIEINKKQLLFNYITFTFIMTKTYIY